MIFDNFQDALQYCGELNLKPCIAANWANASEQIRVYFPNCQNMPKQVADFRHQSSKAAIFYSAKAIIHTLYYPHDNSYEYEVEEV